MKVMNRSLNHLKSLNKMTKIVQVYKNRCLTNGLDVNENHLKNGINDETSDKVANGTNERMKNSKIKNHNTSIKGSKGDCIKSEFKINDTESDLIRRPIPVMKDKELNREAIDLANRLLSQGKLVALPTDTIYGIACLVESDESLARLNEIKGRDLQTKALAICVNDLNDVYKWGNVTVDRQVLSDLLPGPITVMFERSKLLNNNFNPSFPLVAIRIPDDQFVRSLTCVNNPLALTSANLSTEPSAGSIEEFKKLWPKLDAIFDGGQLNERSDPFCLGSTIVDLSVPNKFKIIRKGCAIDKVLSVLQHKYKFEQS